MAVDINGDGLIALGGTSTTQGRVRLAEDTDNGTNYVELTANAAVTSNRTVTFPDADINFVNGLGVAQGGTGQNTYTNGQLLIGNSTGNTLTKATLTAGSGISITNGTGSITIAASGAGGFSGSQGFSNPGTFTAPPTTNQVYVMLQAGGGGGGGRTANAEVGGGSGGGGGAGFAVVPVTGGSPYPVTVGAGGTAGNSAPVGNPGNAGGASSFSNLISANGGGGGNGASSQTAQGNPGSGGNGVAPTGTGISGQAGSASTPAVTVANGGDSVFGAGSNFPGIAAIAGGGGAGGPATPASPAQAGAAGFVFVAY